MHASLQIYLFIYLYLFVNIYSVPCWSLFDLWAYLITGQIASLMLTLRAGSGRVQDWFSNFSLLEDINNKATIGRSSAFNNATIITWYDSVTVIKHKHVVGSDPAFKVVDDLRTKNLLVVWISCCGHTRLFKATLITWSHLFKWSVLSFRTGPVDLLSWKSHQCSGCDCHPSGRRLHERDSLFVSGYLLFNKAVLSL